MITKKKKTVIAVILFPETFPNVQLGNYKKWHTDSNLKCILIWKKALSFGNNLKFFVSLTLKKEKELFYTQLSHHQILRIAVSPWFDIR